MSVASMIALADQTCQFKRPTRGRTSTGAVTQAPMVDIGTPATPCWMQPASGDLVTQYEARSMRLTHHVYTTTSPNIKEGDIIVVTGADPGRSLARPTYTLLIHAVLDQAGLRRCYRFDCEEARP